MTFQQPERKSSLESSKLCGTSVDGLLVSLAVDVIGRQS